MPIARAKEKSSWTKNLTEHKEKKNKRFAAHETRPCVAQVFWTIDGWTVSKKKVTKKKVFFLLHALIWLSEGLILSIGYHI